METEEEFKTAADGCRAAFVGLAECDGLFTYKANDISKMLVRLRRAEERKSNINAVSAILAELINTCVMKLMELSAGKDKIASAPANSLVKRYDNCMKQCLELMEKKNHDYDEAWRLMRPTSYTDLMLVKAARINQIEQLGGQLLVSEGIDSNYFDIINYAVFYLIRNAESQ